MGADPSILPTTKYFTDQYPKVRTMSLKPIKKNPAHIKPREDLYHHHVVT